MGRLGHLGIAKSRFPYSLWGLVAAILAFSGEMSWADVLHRLNGFQIQQQFTGKVLTDGTHWRETYVPGGKLVIDEMGLGRSTGSWRVADNRLCKLRPGILSDCYEVWAAGARIELRITGAPPMEAFLRTATPK